LSAKGLRLEIKVIGGGLSGAEAAFQMAERGVHVLLFEMRPVCLTPAHKTSFLSELVCSNSLKSKELTNAHGLLKEELRRLGSLLVPIADQSAIPGGKALVVDRDRFAAKVTETLEGHKNITVIREQMREIPEGVVVIATGPLTGGAFAEKLRTLTAKDNLYFFDAISPIVDASSIDMERAFFGSRYMNDSDDYLNCPLTQEEYQAFHEALMTARRVDLREFEGTPFFEGCLPIEVMAERGRNTLLFGPMKPVGMIDTRTGREPFAIVQLRRENQTGTMYNMVGFQTKLTYPEQQRVFGLIPALRNASFFRFGSIHRNTFVKGPEALCENLSFKGRKDVFLAGQITGVEGYMESMAMGLLAGLSAFSFMKGSVFTPPPATTCVGALLRYVTTPRKDFQPMNINFGILEGYNKKRKDACVRHALSEIEGWKKQADGFAE
jgi:methylenetetrahydrofolate--tRNA-(uracil-5-)-methyltransferase